MEVDYFQEINKRNLESKLFILLKHHYFISVLHSFAGKLILNSQITLPQNGYKPDSSFLYRKDLERETSNRYKAIIESETRLEPLLVSTKASFVNQINSLNLPTNIMQAHFHKRIPNNKPDLIYLYSPAFNGAQIVNREDYEEEIKNSYFTE